MNLPLHFLKTINKHLFINSYGQEQNNKTKGEKREEKF